MTMGALDCVTNGQMKSTESTEVFTVSSDHLDQRRRDLESQFTKINTDPRNYSIWWTLSIDISLLVIVGILIGLFELGVIPSHKSGFFCNDPALAHKFTGDTVSAAAIILSVVLLPVGVNFITEYVFLDPTYLQRSRGYQAIRNTLWLYRSYAIGLFFNFAVLEVIKGFMGRPRPIFFDVCEPDTLKTCNGSEYVSTFKCTPSTRFSAWFQADASHSFLSGHTSLSVYCGLFMAWYLQRRAFDWTHRTVMLVPVLQVFCLSYSLFCSLTRITDHVHHWWDVLAGTALGIVCAFYTVIVLCDNFSYAKSKTTYEITDEIQPSTLLFENPRTVVVP